jgi:hypothetical protein
MFHSDECLLGCAPSLLERAFPTMLLTVHSFNDLIIVVLAQLGT